MPGEKEFPVMSIDDVAALLGVKSRTVTQWMVRSLSTPGPDGKARLYAADPFPAPNEYIGKSPVWLAERRAELEAWKARRPGRGVGGGRPRKVSPSGD